MILDRLFNWKDRTLTS